MNILRIIHYLVFVAGLAVPFCGTQGMLRLYSLFIPFMFLHWILNDDMCSLTMLEQIITGKKKEETFMGQFLKPIFKLPDDKTPGKLMAILFFFLWLWVQVRLEH